MARIEKSIDVNVPVQAVYIQLTQFDEYPRFMEGVEEVRLVDDTHLHWRSRAGDHERQWDAEITVLVPDRSIAWRNINGVSNEGRIELQALDNDRTRVTLVMECDASQQIPIVPLDEAESALARRTEEDLARFKKFIERLPHRHAAAPDATPEAAPQPTRQGGRPQWLPHLLQAWEEPLTVVRRMSEEMDQFAQRVIGRPLYGSRARQGGIGPAWTPPVEVARCGDEFFVYAELPGVRREDVHIEIRSDKLTIEGDRRPRTQQEPQPEYQRSERSYGHFYRVIALPDGADEEAVSASMHDGLLEIRVPLSPQARNGKRVDIR